MSVTGLITVRAESRPLLSKISIEQSDQHIQATFHLGTLADRRVVLVELGPGKIQAAAAAQVLIDRYGVDRLISCGSAGAIDPQLNVGDIVLTERVIQHDTGWHTEQGLQYVGIYDNLNPDGLHYYRHLAAQEKLVAQAQRAAASIAFENGTPRIFTGCLVSGDQVIAAQSKRQWLHANFEALAVEMETGAMAHVALLNDVPWMAIRAISDQADASIDFNLLNLITYVDGETRPPGNLQQKAVALAKLATTPQQFHTLRGLRKRLKQAAYNAAQVVAAMIITLD
ncbi:MAG: 5'-methylthioadenosine/S-adenosylhomocysteine nucleosidase [Anaerolineae bacterium]|nr:5'-methylthioadenosine/S-adenosylhomocysteine nucleosidase [Anaerolineae bacterium]